MTSRDSAEPFWMYSHSRMFSHVNDSTCRVLSVASGGERNERQLDINSAQQPLKVELRWQRSENCEPGRVHVNASDWASALNREVNYVPKLDSLKLGN